ncbi:hypothetical protein BS50DRAFT_24590 [Corynespora cassiicola Philippines]|uniref:Uncharacterized protein n=1 Tax=Corynespora cassiicola Philippines TaxID=1448308 RepID=A0A2T2PB84_CORCC|nr:hypothetical protein BS50DRAFT_24590 [Corynespora cassiicola Philippines]
MPRPLLIYKVVRTNPTYLARSLLHSYGSPAFALYKQRRCDVCSDCKSHKLPRDQFSATVIDSETTNHGGQQSTPDRLAHATARLQPLPPTRFRRRRAVRKPTMAASDSSSLSQPSNGR